MKKFIPARVMAVTLFLLLATSVFAGGLEELAGKWTLKGTNDNGVAYTQTLEIKKGRFTFQMTGPDKKSILYAKGDVKVEMTHSLNIATFSNIEGGRDADDVNPIDDDRNCVYTVDGGTFTLALDFDKDRNKSPRVEAYTKSTE